MEARTFTSEDFTYQEPTTFSWIPFLFIVGLATALTVLNNVLLIDDNMYFEFYTNQLTYERIEEFIKMKDRYAWFGYALVPVVYLLKLTAVACCLSIGNFLNSRPLSFGSFFRIATQAELVLLVGLMCKLIWFLLIDTSYNLVDIQTFYPLALTNFFSVDSLPAWGVYPIQQFNVFELVYWFILAHGVSQVVDISWPKALGMVAASYGVGLVSWVAFVMFLTVNFS